MGYTTEFSGEIVIEPPLNEAEIAYLNKFAETRRMDRENGPYFVDGTGSFGQGRDVDIRDYNSSDPSQPGLWCQWVPNEDGTALEWNYTEKFYYSEEWMRYLIDNFLKPHAKASHVTDLQFIEFTFDHVLNGEIIAQGEEIGDLWKLIVTDNEVTRKDATF